MEVQMKKWMVATVGLALTISGHALAQQDKGYRHVVKDQYGNPVASSYRDCVYTQWSSDEDECYHGQGAVDARVAMTDSRSFLVFFDFDRSNVTQRARNIISRLAGMNATGYRVVGHADRSGSDAYNMRLSKRRAEAVRQAFAEEGIARDKVVISWKGESDPLIQTGDGIREAQNRRSEIILIQR